VKFLKNVYIYDYAKRDRDRKGIKRGMGIKRDRDTKGMETR
jgi:hypothetical protein